MSYRKSRVVVRTVIVGLLIATAAFGQSTIEDESIDIALESVAEGLTAPLGLTAPPDDTGRLFVVDQAGMIRVIAADGELLDRPFLDVRDRMVDLQEDFDERGLLGMAFHPGYADNGRLFVYYSAPLREAAPDDWNHTGRLAEYTVSSDDPNVVDPGSERILLEVDEPQFNHNGGQVLFGPGGYLYVSLGDGGGANDVGTGHPPIGNGQDRTTLLGAILRIDVDGGDPYGIPPDNPFVGESGRDEIYAYGLRNPFRMSFDAGGDRALYVGDVGQDLWEEIDIVEAGGNYGWNLREGTHCFDPDQPGTPPASCPDEGPNGAPLIGPVIEYGHPGQPSPIGLSVIGGFVYRGDTAPKLSGGYVFGDWSASFSEPGGVLLAAMPDGDGLWPIHRLAIEDRQDGELGAYLLGFGTDADGELYVLTTRNTGPVGSTGAVHRMVSSGSSDASGGVNVDGTILSGEYPHQTTIAGVELHWWNDDRRIAIGLKSPGTGHINIGFDPQRRMEGAGFVLAAVVDGRIVTRDDYGVGPTSHQADVSLGGTDDIVEAAGSESDAGTTVEFLFPLNTGDRYDAELTPGETVSVIVAYHDRSDDFGDYHGFGNRGEGTITLDEP